MAQVVIVFGGKSAATSLGLPIMGISGQAEEITSSGTSQSTTMTANGGDIARITAIGGKVWVKFGLSPTAAVADLHFILDGQTLEFGPLERDYKCAVIDDS